MKSGDCTSVRFFFALFGVNERNGDISPTNAGMGRRLEQDVGQFLVLKLAS
jgi:hypothetical protein